MFFIVFIFILVFNNDVTDQTVASQNGPCQSSMIKFHRFQRYIFRHIAMATKWKCHSKLRRSLRRNKLYWFLKRLTYHSISAVNNEMTRLLYCYVVQMAYISVRSHHFLCLMTRKWCICSVVQNSSRSPKIPWPRLQHCMLMRVPYWSKEIWDLIEHYQRVVKASCDETLWSSRVVCHSLHQVYSKYWVYEFDNIFIHTSAYAKK